MSHQFLPLTYFKIICMISFPSSYSSSYYSSPHHTFVNLHSLYLLHYYVLLNSIEIYNSQSQLFIVIIIVDSTIIAVVIANIIVIKTTVNTTITTTIAVVIKTVIRIVIIEEAVEVRVPLLVRIIEIILQVVRQQTSLDHTTFRKSAVKEHLQRLSRRSLQSTIVGRNRESHENINKMATTIDHTVASGMVHEAVTLITQCLWHVTNVLSLSFLEQQTPASTLISMKTFPWKRRARKSQIILHPSMISMVSS